MLRILVAFAVVALAVAESDVEPRLGFPSISNGQVSLTFNETSINNALLLGGATLLVLVIALPLLGITVFGGAFDVFGLNRRRSSQYETYAEYDPNAYQQQAYDYTQSRSLKYLNPVLSALKAAYEKYEAVN